MEFNLQVIIQEMIEKWAIIFQSLTSQQLKANKYSIDVIKKNLATIEAIEAGIINKLSLSNYLRLC